MSAIGGGGLPSLRGIEHVALTVPSLEQAVSFFCDVLGCVEIFRHGPHRDDRDGPDNWFVSHVGLHPRSVVTIAMLRCGTSANLELFEFKAPGQKREMPQFSDVGGAHLSFYVDDIEAASQHLRDHKVECRSAGVFEPIGPEAGVAARHLHFVTPWGQPLELTTYPNGRAYEQYTAARMWKPE